MHKTGMGRELRNESIESGPCSLNFVDNLLREVLDFLGSTSFTFVISFFPFTMRRSGFTFSNF